MEEKEQRKEIGSFLGNINKSIRKERISTLCLLVCSALVIGTALGFLLGYGYTQKLESSQISAHFEEKASFEGQQEAGGSSVAVAHNTDSAPIPRPTETAAVPASQAEPDAPFVTESQNPELTSITQPAETADISDQQAESAHQAELAAPPDTESENIESDSMSQSTEYANIPDSKPGYSKHTWTKKRKLKSATQRRTAHRKTQCVTFFPERQNYHYGFPAVSN